MAIRIDKQITALRQMTVTELRSKHIEVFGEPTGSCHKDYLVKRIAWRLQALSDGSLSERARRRAQKLANEADLRSTIPKVSCEGQSDVRVKTSVTFDHDPRVPLPGSILTRRYKDRDIVVKVLPKGFEYESEIYRTLSAITKAITGKHWNGYHFFNLTQNGNRS